MGSKAVSESVSTAPIARGGALQLRDLPAWVPFALIAVFGLFAYGLSLNSDFYMDDHPFVLEQETVQGGEWAPHGRGFRHVPFLLWRGIYGVAGASAPAFHALNFAVHLATASALFAFGLALFRKYELAEIPSRRAALVGALIFVVHPLASEAVNYVRCAEILLVTLFTLLSAWCLLRLWEKPSLRFGAGLVACAIMAIFSKDPGIFHLATTLGLIAWAFWERGMIRDAVAKAWNRSKPITLGTAFVLLLSGAVFAKQWIHIALYKFARTDSEYIWEHTLTQGRVFWAYLARMIAPLDLHSDHLLAWSTSASDLPALLGLCGVIALLIATAFAIRNPRTRLIGLLFALLLAPLALRFLYPNRELFVEYRAYPALPFFGLLAGLALSSIYERAPAAGKWAGLGLLIALAGLSLQRTSVWGSAEWLAEDVIERYPLNNRARTQLQGHAYLSGDYQRVFELATEIRENYVALGAANARMSGSREYDPGRATRNLANCEQLCAYALAEVADSRKALEFTDTVISKFKNELGPFESEKEFEMVAGALLKVREELAENGEAYDRLRREKRDGFATTGSGEPE